MGQRLTRRTAPSIFHSCAALCWPRATRLHLLFHVISNYIFLLVADVRDAHRRTQDHNSDGVGLKQTFTSAKVMTNTVTNPRHWIPEVLLPRGDVYSAGRSSEPPLVFIRSFGFLNLDHIVNPEDSDGCFRCKLRHADEECQAFPYTVNPITRGVVDLLSRDRCPRACITLILPSAGSKTPAAMLSRKTPSARSSPYKARSRLSGLTCATPRQ